MAMTFNFYGDAGLLAAAATTIYQASSGATGAVDVQIWIGSTDATKKIQANSNPGVDHLVVTVTDSAPSSGQAASAVQLSLTQLGLDMATPGASLDLGVTEILGGVAESVTFWLRVEATSLVDGTYTDLGLKVAAAIQTTV